MAAHLVGEDIGAHAAASSATAEASEPNISDVSNPRDPSLVAAVELPCGSHTVTLAGTSAGRLIVYSNNSSSAGCGTTTDLATQNALGDLMDVIAVPLGDPAGAHLLRREPLAGPSTAVRTGCHDAGVILGDVDKAACASADTINVWDIGANDTPGGASRTRSCCSRSASPASARRARTVAGTRRRSPGTATSS